MTGGQAPAPLYPGAQPHEGLVTGALVPTVTGPYLVEGMELGMGAVAQVDLQG